MSVDAPQAPVQGTQTFGGLVKAASGETKTLFVNGGLTMKGTVKPSPENPAELMAEITVATDEAGTIYSAMSMIGGNYVELAPADGDVVVLSYDAGCDDTMGPSFYLGGISYSLSKPGGRAVNGVMSVGVKVLGADGVFSGFLTW